MIEKLYLTFSVEKVSKKTLNLLFPGQFHLF